MFINAPHFIATIWRIKNKLNQTIHSKILVDSSRLLNSIYRSMEYCISKHEQVRYDSFLNWWFYPYIILCNYTNKCIHRINECKSCQFIRINRIFAVIWAFYHWLIQMNKQNEIKFAKLFNFVPFGSLSADKF